MAGHEQRKSQRDAMVALAGTTIDDLAFVERDILDISEGGAFVTGEPPRQEEEVTLHGSYRGRPFIIEGKVQWVGESPTHKRKGFGIQIDSLPSALKEVVGK